MRFLNLIYQLGRWNFTVSKWPESHNSCDLLQVPCSKDLDTRLLLTFGPAPRPSWAVRCSGRRTWQWAALWRLIDRRWETRVSTELFIYCVRMFMQTGFGPLIQQRGAHFTDESVPQEATQVESFQGIKGFNWKRYFKLRRCPLMDFWRGTNATTKWSIKAKKATDSNGMRVNVVVLFLDPLAALWDV